MPGVLTTLTLLAVLHAGDPAPTSTPAEPDGVTLDSQRVKRFVGALVGGAIGIAIPLAISAPNCTSVAITCTSSFQNFSLGIMPLVAGLGAYFGHHLFGGEAEYPFAAIGAGLGSLLGMLMLGFAEGTGVAPTALFPYVAGVAGLTTFIMAIALDWRDHSLVDLPPTGHGTGARLWASFGASVGIGIAGSFLSLLLGLVNTTAGVISGVVVLGAMPLAAWGVHSALDGKGSVGSAFLGLAIALGVLAAVAVPVIAVTNAGFSPFYSSQQGALLTGSAFLALLLGPIIGLELSHSAVVRESPLKPSFSFSPVPGGAMVGGGVQF